MLATRQNIMIIHDNDAECRNEWYRNGADRDSRVNVMCNAIGAPSPWKISPHARHPTHTVFLLC